MSNDIEFDKYCQIIETIQSIINNNTDNFFKSSIENFKSSLNYIFLFCNAMLIIISTFKFQDKHFISAIALLSSLNIVTIVFLYFISSQIYNNFANNIKSHEKAFFEKAIKRPYLVNRYIKFIWSKYENYQKLLGVITFIIYFLFIIEVILITLNILIYVNKG